MWIEPTNVVHILLLQLRYSYSSESGVNINASVLLLAGVFDRSFFFVLQIIIIQTNKLTGDT